MIESQRSEAFQRPLMDVTRYLGQVGNLGRERILWSFFLTMHLSYHHHVYSDVSILVGAKERGGQTMGLYLPCDHFYMAEIGIK